MITERARNAQTRGDGRGVRKKLSRVLVSFPSFDDRSATLRLNGHHARALGADPSHPLHFVEGFAHTDQANSTAGWIENDLGQFSAELFPQLVAHGFLAFHAVRLLERGDVVPPFAVLVFGDVFTAIG